MINWIYDSNFKAILLFNKVYWLVFCSVFHFFHFVNDLSPNNMTPRIVFGMAMATASLLAMGTNAFVPTTPLKTRITPTRNPNDENLHRILTSLDALSFNVSLDRPEEDRWAQTADREESLLDAECILTIGGMRYNMTSWARAHPGGPNILRRFHGKDATSEYIIFYLSTWQF